MECTKTTMCDSLSLWTFTSSVYCEQAEADKTGGWPDHRDGCCISLHVSTSSLAGGFVSGCRMVDAAERCRWINHNMPTSIPPQKKLTMQATMTMTGSTTTDESMNIETLQSVHSSNASWNQSNQNLNQVLILPQGPKCLDSQSEQQVQLPQRSSFPIWCNCIVGIMHCRYHWSHHCNLDYCTDLEVKLTLSCHSDKQSPQSQTQRTLLPNDERIGQKPLHSSRTPRIFHWFAFTLTSRCAIVTWTLNQNSGFVTPQDIC